ncbi:hypothetical protein NAS2_0167 [Conexivisphaera calida]|uniref:Uncharacterized protein n=1 Tax=Conexivisphaera calida TaxID=1874277 RepID=A0A4P2VJU5_9ARCH|nr:hypothetical protein NAS2_0167 [Conexivisphaera calida]
MIILLSTIELKFRAYADGGAGVEGPAGRGVRSTVDAQYNE